MKRSWKWRLGLGALVLAGLLVLAFAGVLEWSLSHPAPPRPVTTAAEAIAEARKAWENTYEKANWLTIFSPEETSRFEPYRADYLDGYWIVWGTIPPDYEGEILVTRIRASDGGTLLSGIFKSKCLKELGASKQAAGICKLIESETSLK